MEILYPDETMKKLGLLVIISILLTITLVCCSNYREIESFRYCLVYNKVPQNKKTVNPRIIREVLRNTLKNTSDTLSVEEWDSIVPFLYLLKNLGWQNNKFIYASMGQDAIIYEKSYIESAYYWSLEHKKELTSEKIYRYICLKNEYMSHRFDIDTFELYERWVDSIFTEQDRLIIK